MGRFCKLEFVVSLTPDTPTSVAKDIKNILKSSILINAASDFFLLHKSEESENLVAQYTGTLLKDGAGSSEGNTHYSESKKKVEAEVIRIMRKIYDTVPQCDNVLVNITSEDLGDIKKVFDGIKDFVKKYKSGYYGFLEHFIRSNEYYEVTDKNPRPVLEVLEKVYRALEGGQIDEAESLIWDLVVNAKPQRVPVTTMDRILKLIDMAPIYMERDYDITIAISISKNFPFRIMNVIDELLKSDHTLNSIRRENTLSSSKRWITLLCKGVVRCDTSLAISKLIPQLSQQISEQLATFVTSSRPELPAGLYKSQVIVFVPYNTRPFEPVQICSSCVRRFQRVQNE